jgi:small-conductance mechanosensitive channel
LSKRTLAGNLRSSLIGKGMVLSPTLLRFLTAFAIGIVIFLVLYLIVKRWERKLLGMHAGKKQRHNIKVFSSISVYVFLIVIMLSVLFFVLGSFSGLGIGLGLLTASLGFALQKPISGIAAWLMVIVSRPFVIGDRIIVNGVRGDVIDIKITHIYIAEIGGIVPGEESSKRIILVPNAILFEQNVTNYTGQDDYMLDQVSFTITFESDIDAAVRSSIETTERLTQDIIKTTGQKPYSRVFFSTTGVSINIRYMSPVARLQEYSSLVTRGILQAVRQLKGVELAYPHTKVILKRER